MQKLNRKVIFIFFAILVIGVFLRLYKLDNQPFEVDEFLGLNASYGYHQTGEWKFWDFNKEKITDEAYSRATVYYWQVAKVFDFFEPTENSARLISAGWGILGIIFIFLISFIFFRNPYISLFSAFLLAISISALIFDRKLRMYSMFAPLYLALSLVVFRLLESKFEEEAFLLKKIKEKIKINSVWIYGTLAAIFSIISLQTHALTLNIFPVITVYLMVMVAYQAYKSGRLLNKYFVLLIGIAVLGAASLVLFRTEDNMSVFDFVSFFTFKLSYMDKLTLDYSYFPLVLAVFLSGIYFLLKNHGKIGLWIVLSFFVPLALAVFVWKRPAGHQYVFFIESFKIIIMASGVFYIADYLNENAVKFKRQIFWVFIISMLVILPNYYFFFSQNSIYAQVDERIDYRKAFAYLIKKASVGDTLIARNFRNFYYKGKNLNVFDLHAHQSMDAAELNNVMFDASRIWVVIDKGLSGMDNETRNILRANFEIVKKFDDIYIYKWEKIK